MRFDAAARIADAVLYEGLVLYPDRASSAKNRIRWQFGVLAPKPPHEADADPWFSQTECLVQPFADPCLWIRIRCLRAESRMCADVVGRECAWLDAAPQTIDLPPIGIAQSAECELAIEVGGVHVRTHVYSESIGDFIKLGVQLENREPWQPDFASDRDAMLRLSLIGAHLLLSIDGGRFISMTDPVPAAASEVARCVNLSTWPVLVGNRGRDDLMLSSPIVLYDYPAVAPQGPSEPCEATEIEEILSLPVMSLTDEEQR